MSIFKKMTKGYKKNALSLVRLSLNANSEVTERLN